MRVEDCAYPGGFNRKVNSMLRFICTGLLLALMSISTQAEEPIRQLIAKAIEAHGGRAALKESLCARVTADGVMKFMGKHLPFTLVGTYDLPHSSQTTIKLDFEGKELSLTQSVVNGQVGMKLSGFDLPVDPKLRREILATIRIQHLTKIVPLDQEIASLKLIRDVAVKNTPCSAIQVKDPVNGDILLYFAADSSLLVKIERVGMGPDQQEGRQEIYLLDHQRNHKIMIPKTIEIYTDGQLTTRTTNYRYEYLQSQSHNQSP